MTKKWRDLIMIMVLFVIVMSSQNLVLANEQDDLIKSVGFTYQINHPENQIGKKGALNLMMAQGQKQEVSVSIENLGEAELILDLSLNGARTNGSGGLEYGPSEFAKDKSMIYDLSDLVEIPQEITIPAKSTQDLILKLTMPEVAYDGIVTGGIQLQEKDEDKESIDGTGIVNKVAYLFGITLQMTENVVIPDLELSKIYAEQSNYRNAVFFNISNTQAVKIEGLMLDIEITKQGKSDVLFESKKNNMKMAPNTLMAYPVSLGGEKMIAGTYTANIKGSAQGENWEWTQDFEISNKEADKFNQQDVSLVQERGIDWRLIGLIVFTVMFIMVVLYFLYRQKNKEKNSRKSGKKSTQGNSR